ncbi:MAG: hypothetical protein M3Z36_10115 [Acidobacteriota bacterium]|nr:hypothetical protein [Acidobacteriota bacterium]
MATVPNRNSGMTPKMSGPHRRVSEGTSFWLWFGLVLLVIFAAVIFGYMHRYRVI